MLLPILTAYEKEHISERQPLPERYLGLSDEELDRRIEVAKATLGRRVVILGHHYQRDEVIKFADYTGDSYKLARQVSRHPDADFIVFCGVHFMAESADILRQPHQTVVLPDLKAGCSMADMAGIEDVEEAWDRLTAAHGDTMVPVTYMNSSAALKAFCGERGGVVCTSSNARAVLEWAWSRARRVFFFPDQHLGRNTGFRMGIPLEQMRLWDPCEDGGGLTADEYARAMGERPGIRVTIEGHCDERGSEKYNLALGDKRANATKQFLVGQGVATDRVETISYGEEKPVCTDHSEECWQKNRRDHFVLR